MPHASTVFVCSNCDAQFAKWAGRCLECGQWGTLTEQAKFVQTKAEKRKSYPAVEIPLLTDIRGTAIKRITTPWDEFNRVVGGGLVPGSLILLGGEPGIGKSTLALQLATVIPNSVYISGEESAEQIKLRAERLGVEAKTLRLASTTHIESILGTLTKISEHGCRLAIIDSIQTIYSDEVEGEAGNLNQVRACTVKLMELAKTSRLIIALIGQVTKEGAIAGPKTLEHLVDVVLYLEGDKYHTYRVLRTAKNRFGSTDEIGVFAMEASGLREVKNPSEAFLSGRSEAVPGSTATCLIEGNRPIVVEIQALVTKTNFGYPQRRASGFDLNRLQVLIGVLSKRTGLPLESYDVFLNVVGGLRADEPAVDLAVIVALASGLKNKTLPLNVASFGEVGLGGEVRPVSQAEKRLQELKKIGFEFVAIPFAKTLPKSVGIKIAPVKNVKELVERVIQ